MGNHFPTSVALKTTRLLSATALVGYGTAYVVQGAASSALQYNWSYALMSAAFLAFLIATFAVSKLREHLAPALLALMYLASGHAFVMAVTSHLASNQVIGVLLVVSGFMCTAMYTIGQVIQLRTYIVLAVVAGAVSAAVTHDPLTPVRDYLLSLGALLVLAQLTVHDHLKTADQLWRSEKNLRNDVIKRKRTELALQHSELEATAVIRAMPDILVRLTPEGTVNDVVNPKACDIGPAIEKFVGRSLASLRNDADNEAIREAIKQSTRSNEPVTTQVTLQIDGEPRDVELRFANAGDDEVLVIVRDVTQEHALQTRLRITDRLVSLGTLAGGVAHEINNPLSYVVSNVEFVGDSLRNASCAGTHEDEIQALSESLDGARRIRDIVASLKEHTRDEEQALRPVDANEIVLSSLRMLDNQLRHRCRVHLALGEIPPVLADPSRLSQVVLNLVANAIHALPERHISRNMIEIATTYENAHKVVIEVKDNGSGVPESLKNRIFDPFFTTRSPGVGTGLGLYLCHNFVTSFGGKLTVDSREGEGATFRVSLSATARKFAQSLQPQAPILDRCKILIVDDEPLVARALRRILRSGSLEVVSSGKEALKVCRAKDFELILCDMMMPEMNGAEFYNELRHFRPDLVSRVLFMTGGAFTPYAKEFLDSVPNGYIEKPISREKLLLAAHEQLVQPMRGAS